MNDCQRCGYAGGAWTTHICGPLLTTRTVPVVAPTYDKTPVDCLLSDLRVAWECGYLDEAYWKQRMTEFWAEVEPDAV